MAGPWCCGAPNAEVVRSNLWSVLGDLRLTRAGPLFAAAARVGPEEILVTGGYSLAWPATAEAWLIGA